MVDQLEAPAAPPEEGKKKGGKKKFIFIALFLVLGAGGYMFMSGGSAPEEPVSEEPVEGAVIDGATMTVGLAGETPSLARVSFAVVLSEGADSAAVGNRIQILQDAALTTISGYTAAELRTVEGLDRLRADLTARALEVYPDGEVLRVVLTEVIVQ
jgi:flagellar basal body-associated protein FliL